MAYQKLKTAADDVYNKRCTGDVCKGDRIKWVEAVFSGSYRNARFEGSRTNYGEVIKESYGSTSGQHTFTIEIIKSEGTEALNVGDKVRRKGRNIYKNETYRQEWEFENKRAEVLKQKHERGDASRAYQDQKRQGYGDI